MSKAMAAYGVLVLLATPAPLRAQASDASARLHALFDEAWQEALREDPLLATSVGEHRYDDRLPSMTIEDIERRAAADRALLERLRAIGREGLGTQDRISYAMLERQLEDSLQSHRYQEYLQPLTAEWGFHMAFSRLPDEMPFASAGDYRNYVARLRAFPAYLAQHLALLREGIARGLTLPRAVLDGYDATIGAHVVDDPEESVFFAPFRRLPDAQPAEAREALIAEGRAAIAEAIVPGYRELLVFWQQEYLPAARDSVGAFALPEGRDYYAYLVRHFTTLEITPQDVHSLGLEEVARIRDEMQAIIDGLGFEGDFAAFLELLRTDPRFYAETPEALLKEASYIAKRMDGKLPSLFGRLPRLPYGVEPVPPDLAPKFTGGRYVGAPQGSTRAGTYWVNTYDLPSRPLYVLTALTLHEAVPGHHLQIALNQELEDVPEFRRASYVNAFGEGWGLYAEWLGVEAGMYDDPYEEFGRLTYEMWRACRLVVDTGLHDLGWSREQAMEYLASHTALSLHEVRTETDRYISWPGQALAYKMGELKIKQLRRRAEAALGEGFDLREFHDRVLASGSLPLTILEEQIDAYIAERLASAAAEAGAR